MDSLVHYSIPFRGLKNGVHQFDFQIDRDFFRHFEGSPIEEASFDLKLLFDKRPDLFILSFNFAGWVHTACDRCLAEVKLPVEGAEQLIVKFSEEPSEDPSVEHISSTLQELNVARYIYEFICLSLPMAKVYDCEKEELPNCNQEMLQYLHPAEEEKGDNPLWEALKKFKNK